jgi:hypothetical protein
MMEAGELAEAAAIILGFHAPSLTATGGTSPDGGGPPPAGQDEAHIIWAALGPASEPLLYEAVQAVAQEPGEATMGALRARLAELFVGNPDLAQRIEALIAQSGYASLVGQDAHDAFFASATDDFQQLARLRRAFMISVVGATVIPGSFGPVFCTIRGWRPATLSTAAPAGGRLEGWVKGWMTAYAALPLIAFIIILLTNAFYLFEYLSRPSGLIMLLLWLVFYIPGIVGLRQLYWKGRGDNGWQFGLVVALLSIGNAIGIYVAWLGPAFIWLVDQLR